ncbi:MAG: aminoacetone oxidase family FAD-binding enzyme [Fuerstiella sp.]
MNLNSEIRDVIVVGGGAAGLMTAASAGARGKRVLVLEKNRKLGVKILMSGGTRCNITHHCDARGIAEAFGRQGKFLRSALATLSPQDVIRKIEALGVATRVEATGKIFPVSNRAIDVRDALVRLAVDAGATVLAEQPVRRIDYSGPNTERVAADEAEAASAPQFRVQTDHQQFLSRSLVITTGGRSYPGCGTTGDGYAWAESFGHSVVRTVPALTPVVCHQNWIHALRGITVEDVELSVWPVSPKPGQRRLKPLGVDRGPLLLTHFGFSGPTVMNLSRLVAQADAAADTESSASEQLSLRCDFLPTVTDLQLADEFGRRRKNAGRHPVGQLLSEYFPRRLAEALLDRAGIAATQKNAELSKQQTRALIDVLKRNNFPIHGTLGYKKAEVTAGGVNLKEVDSRNMQSKLCRGLFFAGEILDLDGPIGGFNFQAAFSTGWLAGQHV